MNTLPDVPLKMFGREYDLACGRQPSGANWLMAVNRETGAVLPLTVIDGPPTPANVVYVLDVDSIVSTLETAGIIRRDGSSKVNFGFNMCRCEMVHAGLIQRLARLESTKIVEMNCERDGHSR
jgi:hypothetical protein